MTTSDDLATRIRRDNLITAVRLAVHDPAWTREHWQRLAEEIRREYGVLHRDAH